MMDPGNTRSRDTKYNRTLDIKWKMKTLMGEVLIEHDHAYNEILLQLDEIRVTPKYLKSLMHRVPYLRLNSSVDCES